MVEKLPQSPTEWMVDIVYAYRDAAEAIPFGPAVGAELTHQDLFHLAPLVCLKRRGLRRTRRSERITTEAAMSTYVANEQVHGDTLSHSIMAFALCYLASHYALSLVAEEESETALNFVEAHLDELARQIETWHAGKPDASPRHGSAPPIGLVMTAPRYTGKQGQYLAFIYYYTKLHKRAPSEADIQAYFRVSPPAVHQMILNLEKQRFIERTPRQPRSIRLLLAREELPDLD